MKLISMTRAITIGFMLLIFSPVSLSTHDDFSSTGDRRALSQDGELISSDHGLDLATNIAHAIRIYLYNLDSRSTQESLSYILAEHSEIVGIRVVETELNNVFFSYYRDENGTHFNSTLPNEIFSFSFSKTPIEHEGETLGFVELYLSSENFEALSYTEEELQYLSQEPKIVIGVEETPPLLIRGKNGQYSGLLIDYIDNLFHGTPITVEYQSNTFSHLLAGLKSQEMDIIAGAYYHPTRESLGNFSLPFMTLEDYLYVRTDDNSITSIASLEGKTLAIVESYLSIELVKSQYPSVTIHTTKNLNESASLVLSGEVDALLDTQLFVSFLQGRQTLAGLRGVPQSIIPPQKLHFLTNKNSPNLASIIKKLQAKTNDLDNGSIMPRFFSDEKIFEQEPTFEFEQLVPLVLLGLTLFFSFCLVAVLFHKTSKEENFDTAFSSKGFERLVILTITLFSMFVVVCSWYLLEKHKKETGLQTYQNVLQNLNSAEKSINESFELYLRITDHEYSQALLLDAIFRLADKTETVDTQTNIDIIETYWGQYEYFSKKQARQLVDPDGTTLIGPEGFGEPSRLAKRFPIFLEFSLKGETIIRPSNECPVTSDTHSKHCILVFMPVTDKNNVVKAIVIDQLYQNIHFLEPIVGLGAVKNGLVYPMDWYGNILLAHDDTQTEQSRAFTDINNPLLKIVKFSKLGERALSDELHAYTNYKGENVVGVFSWNPRYNFGLSSEIPSIEALASYTRFRYSIVAIILLMLLFTVPLILFTLILGRRANRNLKLSRDQLRELVDQRTLELSNLEKNSRLILSSIGQGLIGTDADFNVVYANEAALKLLMCTKQDIIGESFFGILQQKQSANYEHIVKDLYSGIGYTSEDEKFRRQDGTIFSAECNCQSMVNNNKLQGSVIVFGDITDRLELQRDLTSARDIAEKASHTKGEFLANMSHEIRTPMNAVIGMAYLALQTDLNPKQRNYITKSHNSALLLLGIINDILDFSKMEAGKLKLESTPFDFEKTLSTIAESVGFGVRDKHLELMFKLSSDIPKYVIGDPLRVSQIIMNLANNAVKFTHSGEVTITANVLSIDSNFDLDTNSQKPKAEQHMRIIFSVKDTGIGLSKKHLDNLFESFNQADSSTTRQYGGTGLGLVISKQLCALMGGRIWVKSTLGVGSEFFVEVCLGIADDLRKISEQSSPHSFEHALVIDDNENTLEILGIMCTETDLRVTQAHSGAEAFKMYSETDAKPDLILVDWKMPNLNGFETAEKIVQFCDKTGRAAPTIIMTTAFSAEDAEREANDNYPGLVQSYLCKPITYTSLHKALAATDDRSTTDTGESIQLDDSIKRFVDLLSGARVLLVEDNEVSRELAFELLTSNGIITETACNGAEAVDMVLAGNFDGILMDCQMPIMDGYQATELLRKIEKYRNLPILAMTANALLGDVAKAKESGMNEHIAKPIKVTELFSKMAAWIKPFDENKKGNLSPIDHSRAAGNSHKTDWDFLHSIPNVVPEQGMEACQNNYALYLRLLRKFVSIEKDFQQRFEMSLQIEDVGNCQHIAHSLKGSAANIGAMSISTAAADIEERVKTFGLKEVFLEELDTISAQIFAMENGVARNSSHHSPEQSYDLPVVMKHLNEMVKFLEQDDTRAHESGSKIMQYLSAKPETNELAKKVITALEEYDFDTSLTTTLSIRSILEKNNVDTK